MATIQRTVEVPTDGRFHLDIDISLPEKFPDGGARLEIVFLSSEDMPLAKYKAARTKLRELCKDSGLTVKKFLEMKHTDRELERAIEKHLNTGNPDHGVNG